ncbi:putative porin [Bradyrhizobium sp.]|uniref:putative porin n=1 Tax=Bradyrhizobium sp. TaxID=376 RepID=UPI001ED40048|nr:putative porin [Bradyrhizobium sp.]MBV9979801.1 putative porin [Bradyrhizobium sp.]
MGRAESMGQELALAAAIVLALAAPAAAQDDIGPATKRPTVSRNAPPSSNATVNLINLLVKQGVLSEEQAAALVKQADDEAYVARQAVSNATAKAEDATKSASTAANAVSPPGTKRVTYVPEIVKQQLREDLKKEVMEKAQREGWASPGQYPEWTHRLRFYGDVRTRYEGDFFPKGNVPQVNFNAINTGSPFLEDNINAVNPYFPPTYNTTQDRNRFRFRARLGLDADLFNGFTAGLRIATGENSSPVSTNQTFGASGGNFSKYALWLDRAFLNYQAFQDDFVLSFGRFDNPFWSPTDLVWYKDIGFDGFAAQAKYELFDRFTPFAVAGAFPVFNTDLNAGLNTSNLNGPVKLPSRDKWLFGGQIGLGARLDPDSEMKVAVAYYDFTNVQGQLSSPCQVLAASDTCDTDLLRPPFAQKGNTYMALRNIPAVFLPNPTLNYQFYGLASAFRPLVVSGQVDFAQFNPYHIILDGEYVRNTGWNRTDVAAKVLVNFLQTGPTVGCTSTPCPQIYTGGNQGWMGRLTVGNRELKALWDWNAFAGYKWLESDAVIDAFTDSDFGLGGTNLKGYFVGGNVALGPNVWLTGRWMSANQVAGAPYAVDIFQLDLNARF